MRPEMYIDGNLDNDLPCFLDLELLESNERVGSKMDA